MANDQYAGIDYGMGQTNIDTDNGIRYGVISMHDVLQAWCDSSEADYGKPGIEDCDCPNCGHNCHTGSEETDWGCNLECEECGESFDVELPDCCEPLGHYVDDGEYKLQSCFDGSEIMVLKSPYFTYGQFCSPCVPGAINLNHEIRKGNADNRGYCLSHDWFDSGKAPYNVYSIATGQLVNP